MLASSAVYDRKDRFYRRAKAEGYRSRAAYKLIELDRRYRIFRHGDRVLDLGSAPGGWLQVVCGMVGDRGKIVGVDLAPIEPPIQGARVIQGDLRDERVLQQAASELGGKAHVILSDLAPKLTGIRERDDARAAELAREVLRLLPRLLGEGGKLLLKLFVGPELSSLTGELRARFRDSQVTRPEATRKGSSEVYFVGMGYLGSESDHG